MLGIYYYLSVVSMVMPKIGFTGSAVFLSGQLLFSNVKRKLFCLNLATSYSGFRKTLSKSHRFANNKFLYTYKIPHHKHKQPCTFIHLHCSDLNYYKKYSSHLRVAFWQNDTSERLCLQENTETVKQ